MKMAATDAETPDFINESPSETEIGNESNCFNEQNKVCIFMGFFLEQHLDTSVTTAQCPLLIFCTVL